MRYLSETYPGRMHDKRICDLEELVFPPQMNLFQDTGFQGYQPPGVTLYQPKKKPKGQELTAAEKAENQIISSIRVLVEHVISGVKRCRIVKDIFRNTKAFFADQVMEIACGLYNFRMILPSGCRVRSDLIISNNVYSYMKTLFLSASLKATFRSKDCHTPYPSPPPDAAARRPEVEQEDPAFSDSHHPSDYAIMPSKNLSQCVIPGAACDAGLRYSCCTRCFRYVPVRKNFGLIGIRPKV